MDVQPRALHTATHISLNYSHKLIATLLLATSLLVAPMVEAKRAGGGKSMGMSRSSNSYQQPQNTAPAPNYNTAPTTQKKSNVGGMVAAGVAGAAVGAVAANAMADDRAASQAQAGQASQGLPTWFWLIVIAGLAFFIFRKFGAKKKLAPNPYAPNNTGGYAATAPQARMPNPFPAAAARGSDNTNIFGQSVGGSSAAGAAAGVFTQSGHQLPDGSEPAQFLRIARQRFNHIQAMNSASNVQEIQRYLMPELYQQMYQDIMANRDQDVAEFSNLNAMVADSATENGQYVVSVRFTGTVSEDLNSLPQPFTEIWHFIKPVGSQADWLVAGIQQA